VGCHAPTVPIYRSFIYTSCEARGKFFNFAHEFALLGTLPQPVTEEKTMPQYIDGFIVPVPKAKLATYKAHARKFGKIWREHGALAYIESVGDDTPYGKRTSFPRAVKLKPDEVAWFSWIVYASKKDRERINKAVMADPRVAKFYPDPKDYPFDGKRMIYGGFKVQISL
jgi:uncharacterized protein YbaA (DUF1428 family)